jgi:small-conductance mechanosensitive channel
MLLACLAAMLVLVLPVSASARTEAADAPVPPEPATLRVLNREIVTFRAELGGASPRARAERARQRLRGLPEHAVDEPLTVVPFSLGKARGVQFLLRGEVLWSLVEDDVDPTGGQDFAGLVRDTQARAEGLREAWHRSRDRPLLLRGLLSALVASAVLGFMVWAILHAGRRAVAWLEGARDRIAARAARVDWREFLARLAVGTMKLVQWLVLLALGYAWLRFVLASFVATAPLSELLGEWLWARAAWVGDGMLAAIPGLVSLVIVLVLTRAIVDVLGYFFDAVQRGRLRVSMLHPETTVATRRIVTLLAWGFGIAVAYPYLPGSSSDAFKGLSVLFGLMLTLGSTGVVTQAMSGLVVVYSRALRKGDFVQVNGVEGVVTEVAALATKVVNMRNEEITIPHSVLIASPIHNFSKLAGAQGTLVSTRVTIGYDTPWRQVHAMLIAAAQGTAGVRASPVPFVYQRALSDFYVEYELFASIDRPLERVAILSALHGNIQDRFNEQGVQIMSPHFLAQPDSPVLVPPSRWQATPAGTAPSQVGARHADSDGTSPAEPPRP